MGVARERDAGLLKPPGSPKTLSPALYKPDAGLLASVAYLRGVVAAVMLSVVVSDANYVTGKMARSAMMHIRGKD